MQKRKIEIFCLVMVISFFLAVTPSQAPAADSSTLEKGILLYKQENFDEALPVLKKAKEEDPKSALAAYYLGITYKQLQNYKEAKIQLIDAVSLTPKIKEALMELVEVLYQLNELNEAKSYIEIAEKENIKPTQVAFLKGLVLLKNGENLDAITAFEKAKELDNTLTQAAEYQIGLANLKEKRFQEAKKAFKDIIVLDPNSDLAQLSNEYMEALKRKETAERPFRATLNVSGQYDTNVLLKPGDDTLAANITNESDWREVVTFMGQYKQKVAKRLTIEPQYSMYFAHQNKIGAYDVLSHTVSVTPNYYFDKATLGITTSYNYTDVGREKYLTTISVSPLANLIVGKNHMFQGNFKYQDKDYARTPTIADEDRNSDDYGGGLGYFFFFAENKGFFGLHYGINKEDTEGINWEYLGNRFTASLLYPFLEKFKLSLAGDAFLQNFDNSNTIFNVKRHDKVFTASSMLAYNFWKAAELQFRYTYIKDHSNIAIYDYDRSIYSLGVEYKF